MKGRALKRYSDFIDKITAYAEAVGIKIEYSQRDAEGSYTPSRRVVNVNPDLTDSEEIAVLLHEFGHFLDNTLLDLDGDHPLEIAYRNTYKGTASLLESILVIECENRAWDYGRVIAKKLRIPLGKWYDEVREECLEGYK